MNGLRKNRCTYYPNMIIIIIDIVMHEIMQEIESYNIHVVEVFFFIGTYCCTLLQNTRSKYREKPSVDIEQSNSI